METALDSRKKSLVERLTDVYARGGMELAAFEAALSRITDSASDGELAAEAAALGLGLSAPAGAPGPDAEELIERGCTSGTIREEGEWIKARKYRYKLVSSYLILDFRAYELSAGIRVEIELAAVSANVRLLLPRGFSVEDRIEGRISSVVRNAKDEERGASNVVVLSGTIQSSTVRAVRMVPKPPRVSLWARWRARRRRLASR